MLRLIVKDVTKLQEKCTSIFKSNPILKDIIKDLKDSAKHYSETEKDGCAGLAANQIGYSHRVIIASLKRAKNKRVWTIMINPTIIKKSKETHVSIEGCLSLDGRREVLRHDSILVLYIDENGKAKKETFVGFDACVIQHEIDHLDGKLI